MKSSRLCVLLECLLSGLRLSMAYFTIAKLKKKKKKRCALFFLGARALYSAWCSSDKFIKEELNTNYPMLDFSLVQ